MAFCSSFAFLPVFVIMCRSINSKKFRVSVVSVSSMARVCSHIGRKEQLFHPWGKYDAQKLNSPKH